MTGASEMRDMEEVMRRARPWRDGGYATFPGTGPQGKTCGHCRHIHHFGVDDGGPRRPPRCAKAREMCLGTWAAPIKPAAPACRHFEAA